MTQENAYLGEKVYNYVQCEAKVGVPLWVCETEFTLDYYLFIILLYEKL